MGSDADHAMPTPDRLSANREKNVLSDEWNDASSGKIQDISNSRQGLSAGHKAFEATDDFVVNTTSSDPVHIKKGDKILIRTETIGNKSVRTITRLDE